MNNKKIQKLENLKDFQMKKEEANKVQGGMPTNCDCIIWTYGEMTEDQIGTSNIGTYVDGLSMGTDGYEDF